MSLNLVTLLYLVASVCFIQALKGLSHPDHLASAATCSAWSAWRSPSLTTAALIVKLAGGKALGHGLGAARPGGRRRLRRLPRQDASR